MKNLGEGVPMSVAACRVEPQRITVAGLLSCVWPTLVIATVMLVPFLNNPFRIDDPEYLMIAKQVIKHPTHPMDFDVCWNSIDGCIKQYALTPGNSLMGYLLVPTVLTGSHEWAAHLTQLGLVWIAVIAMASLTLRLGWDRWHATAATLLLVAIPPFLPMACTAMPDVLATSVALVAMERIAAWKEEQRWTRGAAASVALALAGFARPHLALLLPLAGFFLLESAAMADVLKRVRQRFRLEIPVFLGGILLLLLILLLREHDLAIAPPPVVVGSHNIRTNLYTYLLYFAFPLPLAACWVANRLSRGRLRTVLVLFAIALVPFLLRWNLALVLFLAVLGLGALASLIAEAVKKRDHLELALLLWVLIPLPITYYVHLPMKYLLPCVPAVILLCFRLLDGISVRFAQVATIVLIVAGTGYSLVIMRADAEFAEFGKDALYHLIEPHVAAGERVWYPGQYWSYWYAPLAGAQLTYVGGPQPKPGDLLVVNAIADGEFSPLKRFPHRTLVEQMTHKYRFGRTVGGSIGGLYSGFWLWTLSNRFEDRYELWRID
jgi:hypothetical protein